MSDNNDIRRPGNDTGASYLMYDRLESMISTATARPQMSKPWWRFMLFVFDSSRREFHDKALHMAAGFAALACVALALWMSDMQTHFISGQDDFAEIIYFETLEDLS